MEDEGLYNAIIAALAIGIVIVIATLILARPAPETFTELYINDHQQLPRYAEGNQTLSFSYTIASHEKANTTYIINQSITYYSFDRSCELPTAWFEETESEFADFLLLENQEQAAGLTPTRRAISEDPALLIKDTNYTIEMRYRTLQGIGQVIVGLQGINGEQLFAAIINENTQQLTLKTTANVTIVKGEPHTLQIEANNGTLTARLDGKTIIRTKAQTAPGYPFIETTQTYADIISFKAGAQRVRTSYADAQSFSVELANANNTFTAQSPLNFTDFELDARLRPNASTTIGVGTLALRIANQSATLTTDEGLVSAPYNLSERIDVHTATIRAEKGQANAYIDGELILRAPYSQASGYAYISDAQLESLRAHSLQEPASVSFTIAAEELPETFSSLPITGFLVGSTEIDEEIAALYEEERLDWPAYLATVRYQGGSAEFSFQELNTTRYRILIENGSAIVDYDNGTKQRTAIRLPRTDSRQFIIDVEDTTLTLAVDNYRVFSEEAVGLTNGVPRINGTATFDDIIIQDKRSPRVRIYEPPRQTCEPLLINETTTQRELRLADSEKATTFANATIQPLSFDIARIQIALNTSQEVHFWVRRI